MASETVLASKQPAIVTPPALVFSNSKMTALQANKNKLDAADETGCSRLSPRAPRSSVESDESSDEIGQLVIDLDNDDSDKVDGNVKKSMIMTANNYQESPESNNNDTGDADVFASTENTVSTSNVSRNDLTSVHDISSDHLNKSGRTKNKKSSKPNKTKAHSPSLQSETSEVAKVATVSDDRHVVESRLPVPSAGVSLDHSKKTKSSKSKNHKKQSRHADKSHSSSCTIKSDSSVKTKIKSRHANKNVSDKTSAYITNTSDHHVLTQQDGNALSPAMTLASKLDSSTRHICALNDSDKPAKGRTPSRTALMPSILEANPSFRVESKSKDSKNFSEKEQARKRHKRRQAQCNVDHYSVDIQNDLTGKDMETATMQESYEIHAKKSKSEQDVKESRLTSSKASESLDRARVFADSKLNSNESISSQTSETLDKQHYVPHTRKISPNADQFNSSSATISAISSSTSTPLPKFCALNGADINEKPGVKSHGNWRSKDEHKFNKQFEVSRRSVGTLTSTADIGVMTEPDALGPCEPGTNVTLNGIVWQETETGVLVVNVTWRNRTYVGTLLDATKHDWDPPRFQDAENEFEYRGRLGRSQRLRGGVSDNTRKSRSRGLIQYSLDDTKRSPSTAKRKSKNVDSDAASDSGPTRISSKRSRLAPSHGNKEFQAESSGAGNSSSPCSSPDLIECPHPTCYKRYRDVAGLKYHQSHAHGDVTAGSNENKANDKSADSLKSEKSLEKMDSDKTRNELPKESVEAVDKKHEDTQAKQSPPSISDLQVKPDDGHPIPTSNKSYSPSITSNVPSSKTTKSSSASTSKGQSSTNPCDDHESAQAVRTLLQLQDSSDSSLPGLSAAYVQTPPQTAPIRPDPSLASYNLHHPLPPELLRGHSANLPSALPSSLSAPKSFSSTVCTSFRTKSPHFSELTTKRDSAPLPEHPPSSRTLTTVSTVFANGTRSSAAVFRDGSKPPASSDRFYPMQNSPSGFVSDSTLPSSGQRMVKGKVVSIPIDPDYSRGPTNDGKNHSRGFEETRASEPSRLPVSDLKGQSEAVRKVPPAMSPISFPVASASARQAGLSNGHAGSADSDVRRSPFIPISESGSITHPQGFVSKKVPGIILPVFSSGQNGNNVTVTGTFHPHPDPHKPHPNTSSLETNRFENMTSPADSLSNRSNNKPPRSHSAAVKLNPGPTQTGFVAALQAPKSDTKLKFVHSRFGLGLHDMMTIQSKVDNAIADCYSAELANTQNVKTETDSQQKQPPAIDSTPAQHRTAAEKTRPSEVKPPLDNRSHKPMLAEPHKNNHRPQTQSPAEESAHKSGQSLFSSRVLSPHRSSHDSATHQSISGHNFSQAMDPAFQNAFAIARANYAADPRNREQIEQLMQEIQKQQFLRHQQQLQQQLVNDKNRHRAEEKPNKLDLPPKNSGHIPSVFEKAHAWQQHGKPPQVTSSYYAANMPKEKFSPAVSVQSRPAQDVSNMRYKSPQPKMTPALPMPARCHSVSQPGPMVGSKGFPVKSEPVPVRARTSSKEVVDQRPRTPVKMEKGHEGKDVMHRRVASPSTKQGPIQYLSAPYGPFFDLRGIPPLAVPGIPPGYIFSPGAQAVFPPGAWPPVVGRQSPVSKTPKQRVPVRTRSPVKEENPGVKTEEKVSDYSFQYSSKDKRPPEAPSRPFSKPSPSPDSRIIKTAPTPSRKSLDSPSSSSSTHRAPSPPTQMHHHTHHHIHGVYQPPYPYAAAPVLAAPPEAVAATFAIPYPKRE